MNLGGCMGLYDNIILRMVQNSCHSWVWGTYALSIDRVDFHEHELLKIHVILGKLRIRATFGHEIIFYNGNLFVL